MLLCVGFAPACRADAHADTAEASSGIAAQSSPTLYHLLLVAVGALGGGLAAVLLHNRRLAGRVAARNAELERELAERRRVEQALRETEALHCESLRHVSDSVFLTDTEGRLRYASPDCAERLGLRRDAVRAGTPIEELLGREAFDAAQNGTEDGQVRVVRTGVDGAERVLAIHARRAPLAGGSLLFTCRDVTEQERAAQKLEAERKLAADVRRMATLGAVVSSLAHEVNNPNHTITLNLPVLRAAWRDALAVLDEHARNHEGFALANIPYADMRDDVLRLIDEIHESADRIRAIVGGLRGYARQHFEADLRAVDVESVLCQATCEVRAVLDAATDAFSMMVERPLQPVRGNRALLVQVFASMLAHVAGTLRARDERIELRARCAGGEVLVEVRDEGCPASTADIVHLTRPFHEPGGSLELVMAAWIVRQHGGTLTMERCPERGNVLRVGLPALASAAAQAC
ncbi:MAG TPA: ATP-binding protein [Planctomycetota bacterium]|nr:ATP-binding protein [Planctomycetota bacterium]